MFLRIDTIFVSILEDRIDPDKDVRYRDRSEMAVNTLKTNRASLGSLANPVLVYVNPQAGASGEHAADLVTKLLTDQGFIVDVHAVAPESLGYELRTAARRGSELVAVCGGDGTLSTAAQALVGSSTILVPIPTGTLNHFARRYGIASVEDAAQAIVAGNIIEPPVGFVNDRTFINNSSCGLYPFALRYRESIRRWISKWPAYLVAIVVALVQLPMLDLQITVGDTQIRRQTPIFWVGIGKDSFQFPERIPDNIDDHVLEVAIAKPQTRLGLISQGIAVLLRMLIGVDPKIHPGLEVFHASKIVLNARKHIDIAHDGEVSRLKPPLTYSIQRHALRIAAGADYGKNHSEE